MFAAAGASSAMDTDDGAPRWRVATRASAGATEAAPAAAAVFPRLYEVREADTLWGIAQEAYGDGSRFEDILAANPGA